MLISYFCLFAGLVYSASGHSWLACSDYAEKDAADWAPLKCRGFPRHSARYAPKNRFGIDTGFDFRPSNNGPACKTQYGGDSYSNDHPKAIYYRGQQVILAHPMKNHGADPACTNRFIPDNGNAIYRGRVGRDRNEVLSHYKEFLVADLGVSPFGQQAGNLVNEYPKPGFQNAPNFCKDTDRSLGTYSFNVPATLAPGEYTFVWRWAFNSANDLYSTCFDVIVTNSKAERDSMLRERGENNLYVACGGTVSDGKTAGSTIGCDGTNPGVLPPIEPPAPSGGRPRSTTTLAPTRRTTTTRKPFGGSDRRASVKITQITGAVILGQASSRTDQRYINLDFGCPANAHMLNGRLYDVSQNDTQYKVIQEQANQIGEGRLGFVAVYEEPCDYFHTPLIAREGKAYA